MAIILASFSYKNGPPACPAGSNHQKLKVCVMSLVNFESFFDRLGPVLFLGLGAAISAALAGVGS